ncbi:related to 3-oxoacyl-[acyl-carrier-protein] reductase [Rhynchosporium agropyri]|uniref:Related to 3-oxoacyl-[acyl-carrier-protein] reductase n=1 Tax=Rhynchosporium agropyri TaxID=914238 RepID=A0A1E1KUC9_9HELO|nr:related to 3-oxoacyl-[acyl-carrier-protein] reductase [Rhynchosporium agropyri]
MSAARPTHERTRSTNLGGVRPRILDGKLAIVTGASRGIGEAIAHNLASKGANLILNYTSDSSSKATADLSALLTDEYEVTCLVVQADMGLPTGPAHIISTAKNHFSHPKTGKFQIDILVNNAGVSTNLTIAECTIDDFNRQYKINVLGPLLLIQAVLPYLPTDRSGRIVNLSSVSSTQGFIGQSVYGGTKAALEAMTRTWARELADRATVNAINPGPVKTDMWAGTTPDFKKNLRPFIEQTPGSKIRPEIDDKDLVEDAENAGGRPAYVGEIAGVVGMLCTPDSLWCTGQVVCANGGMRMAM